MVLKESMVGKKCFPTLEKAPFCTVLCREVIPGLNKCKQHILKAIIFGKIQYGTERKWYLILWDTASHFQFFFLFVQIAIQLFYI